MVAVPGILGCSGGGDVVSSDKGVESDPMSAEVQDTGIEDPGADVPEIMGEDLPGDMDSLQDPGATVEDLVIADTPWKPELPPECFSNNHCDDGDPCTEDLCDEDKQCTNAPRDCDDGDPCTKDGCEPGVWCVHETIPNCLLSDCKSDDDCVDLNACTFGEQCLDGACSYELKTCPDDGKPCTTTLCDPVSGQCINWTDCDDNDGCTKDWCDPQKDYVCRFTPNNCGDGDSCTSDTCEFDLGCIYWLEDGCQPQCEKASDCDDGDPCTTDQCLHDICNNWWSGSCCKWDPECDDGNPCTYDWCDPPREGQCKHLPLPGCP